MMSDPFIGEIRMLPYTYAPVDWTGCDGQLLQASQNQALLSIVGTTFGGDGQTTVGIPNLQGRSPLSWGQSPGSSYYAWGEMTGKETVVLNESQLPSHTHQAIANKPSGTTQTPDATVLYGGENDPQYQTYKENPVTKTPMSLEAVSTEGAGHGHENRQPFLTVQFCICLNGVYPVRS
jgi:microcystin-dependent protein